MRFKNKKRLTERGKDRENSGTRTTKKGTKTTRPLLLPGGGKRDEGIHRSTRLSIQVTPSVLFFLFHACFEHEPVDRHKKSSKISPSFSLPLCMFLSLSSSFCFLLSDSSSPPCLIFSSFFFSFSYFLSFFLFLSHPRTAIDLAAIYCWLLRLDSEIYRETEVSSGLRAFLQSLFLFLPLSLSLFVAASFSYCTCQNAGETPTHV